MADAHRVVVIGGGFGGLSAVKHLKHVPVAVTLLDRQNYHLFQPLLYQVATGALSPANIAAPLRNVLRKQKNTTVLLGEAIRIDVANRQVVLSDGKIPYDTLIIATGSTHQYYGHNEWEKFAPPLKTIEDATSARARILLAFEAAEREDNPANRHAWMTFVVVGGGPTGVELAGALAEIARDTLKHDFRHIDPTQATILLVETGDRVLPPYPPPLSESARKTLTHLGVTVRTSATVMTIDEHSVTIKEGEHVQTIPTRTVLWAAGVFGSPLGRSLAAEAGATLDRGGRVVVEPDFTVPGHPEIFVIGDLARFNGKDGNPLPGVAQPAIQAGRYAAKTVEHRLRGEKVKPFHYFDKGNLAEIGRAAAVADIGGFRFSGFPAWVIWLFVHLLYIVEFQNRMLVLVQWAWSYLTHARSARLITGKKPFPLDL